MTALFPNPRYEKKFIADGCTLDEILASVRRHPAAFREAYPPRLVNNVYLDSPSRRDYHAHINGAADRSKTRVRWYGPRFEAADRPVLERKLKRGMVSGKEAYALPPLPMNGSRLSSCLHAACNDAALPARLRAALRFTEPALCNRYRRHYFITREGTFRLTVDSHLQFAGMRPGQMPAIVLSPPARTVILELKYAPEVAGDADVISSALPFRVARFSKYVSAMELIYIW